MFSFIRLVIYFLFLFSLQQLFAQVTQQKVLQWNTGQACGFAENKGQFTDQNGKLRTDVKYIFNSRCFKAVFKQNSFCYEVSTIEEEPKQVSEATGRPIKDLRFTEPEAKTMKTHRVDISLPGANANPEIIADGKSTEYNNYYLAHTPEEGVQNVYKYGKLTYKNVWPKIDLVFYANKEGSLKYDIVIHSGGDLENVRIKFDGADNIYLEDNKLNLQTGLGLLTESIPVSYILQNKETVDIKYELNKNSVSFKGKYNSEKTLVIDPVISWGTYYGGTSGEVIYGVDNDSAGNVYITGYTYSDNTIATSGAFQTAYNINSVDAFFVKFNKFGKRQWATYYGGEDDDYGIDLSCDKWGYVYLTGSTNSKYNISTSGAHQTSLLSSTDVFVAKFSSTGKRIWGTYYGGNSTEVGLGVSADIIGNVYISGNTTSQDSIATAGAYQTTFGGGGNDAFIVKFDSSGQIIWGTYFGGNEVDWGKDIDCDTAGNIFLAGYTESDSQIATFGAYQTTRGGLYDAYIAKFDSKGKIQWSTYYGGSSYEVAHGINCDLYGNIYITGETQSLNKIASAGAYDTTFGGSINYYSVDGFVARFNNSGKRIWSTYLGGEDVDVAYDICSDNYGNVYITGATSSEYDISTKGSHKTFPEDYWDVFISKLDSSGIKRWGTYYGGLGFDEGESISCDEYGNVYIAGYTESYHEIATPGAYQTKMNLWISGYSDGFLARFGATGNIALDTLLNSPAQEVCQNDSFNIKAVIKNFDTKTDSNIKVTITIAGKDTLTFSDSLMHKIATGVSDTLNFNKWVCFSKTGEYKLSVYIDPSDENNSDDSIVYPVHVYEFAKPKFEIQSACNDTIVSFVNSSATCNGSLTYLWDFGDGSTSTSLNPTKTYKKNGIYQVKLVVFTSFGKDSLIKRLEYFPFRKVDFSQQVRCGTSEVNFINTSFDSTGIVTSYLWKFGDDKTSTDINPTHIYNYNQAYNVTLITKTTAGCIDSVVRTVEVHYLPYPRFKFKNSCASDSLQFTDETYSTDSVLKYTWKANDSIFSRDRNASAAFSKPGTYAIKLIVENTYGCKDSIQSDIIINPKPEVSFNVDNICVKRQISFENKSIITSGNIVHYLWKFGDGDTSIHANPVHHYDSAADYYVTLIAVSDSGCIDSFTKTISVYDRATPDFSFIDGCLDSSISFTNTTLYTSADSLSYKWDFGDGNISSVKNPVHTYLSYGNYNVKLYVTTPHGCTDSIEKIVTINPKPKAIVSASDICVQHNVSFKNNSTSAGQILTYNWHFGDGDSSTLESPNHIYSSPGKFKVFLSVTNNFGCLDTVSNYITVHALPEAEFTVSDSVSCLSDSILFTNLSNTATEWIWDFGDRTFSSLQHPSHKYFSAGTYMVKLKVRNVNGCTDSLTKQVQIYEMPEAIFSVNDICVTDSFYLADSSKSAAKWFWDFGDGYTATIQNPAHKYSKAGTYTIYLTATNSAGCPSTVSHKITVDSTCIWPGDANADKIVDNKDILAIGLAYADTGSSRTDTNTVWKGHLGYNWSNNFLTGANYKHADSDGDGIVSHSDTLAVTRNYTKTHAKKQGTRLCKNTDPILKIDIQNDSIKAGDTLTAYIVFGENALPVKNVYGLAFSINYNQDYFSSADVDFSGSWLGNNVIGYSNTANGLDIALTRTDHKNTSGFGKIATVKLIVRKDSEIDTKQLKLDISENIMISADEQEIPVNIENDSIITYKEPNSVFSRSKTEMPAITVYPNPFKNQTVVSYELQQACQVSILLYDINGRIQILMPTQSIPRGKHRFIVDGDKYKIAGGVYLIKVDVDSTPVYKRIIKVE